MHYDQKNVAFARQLRKDMTPWERKLWYCFLRTYPVRFHRQKPIGHFIADFYCPKAALIVELDGSGHFEPESIRQDAERTAALEREGLAVIRFPNIDIDKNFEGVCTAIDFEVKNAPPICGRILAPSPTLVSLSEGGGRAKRGRREWPGSLTTAPRITSTTPPQSLRDSSPSGGAKGLHHIPTAPQQRFV